MAKAPLQREVTAADVGAVCTFLASPAAATITGQVLYGEGFAPCAETTGTSPHVSRTGASIHYIFRPIHTHVHPHTRDDVAPLLRCWTQWTGAGTSYCKITWAAGEANPSCSPFPYALGNTEAMMWSPWTLFRLDIPAAGCAMEGRPMYVSWGTRPRRRQRRVTQAHTHIHAQLMCTPMP